MSWLSHLICLWRKLQQWPIKNKGRRLNWSPNISFCLVLKMDCSIAYQVRLTFAFRKKSSSWLTSNMQLFLGFKSCWLISYFSDHVTSLTCYANVKSSILAHELISFIQITRGRVYLYPRFRSEKVLGGTEFWTFNLPTQIFFNLMLYLPYRI